MPLSCGAEYTALPRRLPGTCRQYSKKAILQLTRTTVSSGADLIFRWPYQATVMNMLPAISSTGYGWAVTEPHGLVHRAGQAASSSCRDGGQPQIGRAGRVTDWPDLHMISTAAGACFPKLKNEESPCDRQRNRPAWCWSSKTTATSPK